MYCGGIGGNGELRQFMLFMILLFIIISFEYLSKDLAGRGTSISRKGISVCLFWGGRFVEGVRVAAPGGGMNKRVDLLLLL